MDFEKGEGTATVIRNFQNKVTRNSFHIPLKSHTI